MSITCKVRCIFPCLNIENFRFLYLTVIICRLETTRHVSVISITLSKKELDTSAVGLVQQASPYSFGAYVLKFEDIIINNLYFSP